MGYLSNALIFCSVHGSHQVNMKFVSTQRSNRGVSQRWHVSQSDVISMSSAADPVSLHEELELNTSANGTDIWSLASLNASLIGSNQRAEAVLPVWVKGPTLPCSLHVHIFFHQYTTVKLAKCKYLLLCLQKTGL